jgi:hypothetical protein
LFFLISIVVYQCVCRLASCSELIPKLGGNRREIPKGSNLDLIIPTYLITFLL